MIKNLDACFCFMFVTLLYQGTWASQPAVNVNAMARLLPASVEVESFEISEGEHEHEVSFFSGVGVKAEGNPIPYPVEYGIPDDFTIESPGYEYWYVSAGIDQDQKNIEVTFDVVFVNLENQPSMPVVLKGQIKEGTDITEGIMHLKSVNKNIGIFGKARCIDDCSSMVLDLFYIKDAQKKILEAVQFIAQDMSGEGC